MSDQLVVVVREPTLVAVTVAEPTVVTLAAPGPQGAPGPTGPQGPTGGTSFTHTQTLAQSVWTVTHSLGRYPVAWSLFDDAGRECDNYLIQHLTVNTLLVSMDQPTAGLIRFL